MSVIILSISFSMPFRPSCHWFLSYFCSKNTYSCNVNTHCFNVITHCYNVNTHCCNVNTHCYNVNTHWCDVNTHCCTVNAHCCNVITSCINMCFSLSPLSFSCFIERLQSLVIRPICKHYAVFCRLKSLHQPRFWIYLPTIFKERFRKRPKRNYCLLSNFWW